MMVILWNDIVVPAECERCGNQCRTPVTQMRCPACGGAMRVMAVSLPVYKLAREERGPS